MKEGPFETGGAVPVPSVSVETVHSTEVVPSGDMSVSETYRTLSLQLDDLSLSPVWQSIEQMERADLTDLERTVQSNRAQAATFLRTAEGQMAHLTVLREHGGDTATHVAHIAQSLLIAQTRLTAAAAALENVPRRPYQTEPSEGLATSEVPAISTLRYSEDEGETVAPEREGGNPAIAGIDLITEALEGVTRAGIRAQAHAEVSELVRLRAALIALDRRYQNFTQGTHAESDSIVRNMLATKTRTRIEKTMLEAQGYLDQLPLSPVEPVVAVPDAVAAEHSYQFSPVSQSEVSIVRRDPEPESLLPTVAPLETVVPVGELVDIAVPPAAAPVEMAGELVTREQGRMLAESYVQVLRDVRVLRKMPTRIISGSKEFPEILASREAALVEQKEAYETVMQSSPAAIDVTLQAEVKKAETALTPPTLTERLEAVRESIQAVTPTLGEVKKLKAEAPMNPDVLFHDPTDGTEMNDPFTHLPTVVDASVTAAVVEDAKVEAMETLMEALNETVSITTRENSVGTENDREQTPELPRTLESLKVFIQNYGDNAEVFQHDFDAWVDTIQDVHPSRWRLISRFGSGDTHRDAFDVFKQLTVGEFRDMIRMPESARQSKFEMLKIQPEDFEKWRHEFTYSAMVDGVRDSLHNPHTLFEDWARYTFAAAKIAEQQFSA